MVTPPWPTSSYAFFDLKIVGNIRETEEQFKETEI